MCQRTTSNQSNISFFLHLLIFLVLLSCFVHLCCFEEKSNRFSLMRQGLTLFHASLQVFVWTLACSKRKESTMTQGQQNFMYGKVNNVTSEKGKKAQDVVLGMFLASSHSATILFDIGASHSFISSSFVARHNLLIATMKHTMLFSSPRGEMRTKHVCPTVSISVRGRFSIKSHHFRVQTCRYMSYPVLLPKLCTHRMHDPGSVVPHIRPKVVTDNQMSWIKYNYYYINSVSNDYDDSQWNGIAEDSITPQERQPGQHVV
jgi:hypothetical protein